MGRLRQEDCYESEASVGRRNEFEVNLESTVRPCLKEKKEHKSK